MFFRFGLRSRMAISYVLVSAVVVLVVEAALLAILVPRLRSADKTVRTVKTTAEVGATVKELELQAEKDTAALSRVAMKLSLLTRLPDRDVLAALVRQGAAGEVLDNAPDPRGVRVLAAPGGRVVSSSSPSRRPVGSHLPADVFTSRDGSGVRKESLPVAWAIKPILLSNGSVRDQDSGAQTIGFVFIEHDLDNQSKPVSDRKDPKPEVPLGSADEADQKAKEMKAAGGRDRVGGIDQVLLPGFFILALLVPMGALFGLLSTRGLIRRVRRLAEGTTAMAGGDLSARIPVSGADEVAALETGFNRMAERLDAAVRAERDAAALRARRAERTRIARDLHDSVSQDLFSVSLLAGGLRRALPERSPLRPQAESLERTVERTMREMRALLLELRPIALEDAGLVPALEELCRAYETRLGIRITSEFAPPALGPETEQVVLRVVQEALGNAARHGDAQTIGLSLADSDGRVEVVVRDDGKGFDPATAGERHGMGLATMRDRVAELGGTFEVVSAPGKGTVVRARIPEGTS